MKRIELELELDPPEVPFDYAYSIQSAVYKLIPAEVSTKLHRNGYRYNDQITFRMFNFSRLLGKYRITEKKIIFETNPCLKISSPDDEFIDLLTTSLLKNDLQIGEGRASVIKIEMIKYRPADKICFISPIVVAHNQKVPAKSTTYLSPWDSEFDSVLTAGLAKKYHLLTGQEYKGEGIKLIPISSVPDSRLRTVLHYKENFYIGWTGTYLLQGDKDLIELSYYTGLGQKTSQGCGMFDFIQGVETQWI